MSFKVIPLTTAPNQKFTCTLPINSSNITLTFNIRYNHIAKYWTMSISDKSSKLLLDSIPLLTGQFPAANILEQYSYLNIGSAAIIPIGNLAMECPDDTNLGTEFVLVWGDNFVS